MGRGLSELQRWILHRAGQIRRVYYADILEGFFGWKPVAKMHRYVAQGINPYTREESKPEDVGMLILPGTQCFSRQEIGEKRYAAALASLSRACQRLHQRGLVCCISGAVARWAGVEITEKGREWLSVNIGVNSPQC